MAMKLPSSEMKFPNGLVVPPRTISLTTWQYHVVKHPLGVNRDARRSGDDPEAWGELKPPVVEAGWRLNTFREIAAIDVSGARCGLPEAHGRKAQAREADVYNCWTCPAPVARACEQATHAERPVGPRYAHAAQSVLQRLTDGVLVTRSAYQTAVMRFARDSEGLRELNVLGIGRAISDERKTIAQFKRGDGVVVEFYVHQEGKSASWRTAYKDPCTGAALLSFLLRLPGATEDSLSEKCLVARQWWESHGI